MSEIIQVVTTTASAEDARRIAAAVVERKVAACAQVSGPIESCYRWQGKLERLSEWQCTIKTRADTWIVLLEVIQQLHPYDEPEILALPVLDGSRGYLDWVKQEVDLP